MLFLVGVSLISHTLNLSIVLVSLLLMFIILLQRGKGAGLAGAFDGPGGTAMLGTRTIENITKLTAILAGVWALLNRRQLLHRPVRRRRVAQAGPGPHRVQRKCRRAGTRRPQVGNSTCY